MSTLREDVHTLIAAEMDRTDLRRGDPILCDYLADLARLFVNLLHEESQHSHEGDDDRKTVADWQGRNVG